MTDYDHHNEPEDDEDDEDDGLTSTYFALIAAARDKRYGDARELADDLIGRESDVVAVIKTASLASFLHRQPSMSLEQAEFVSTALEEGIELTSLDRTDGQVIAELLDVLDDFENGQLTPAGKTKLAVWDTRPNSAELMGKLLLAFNAMLVTMQLQMTLPGGLRSPDAAVRFTREDIRRVLLGQERLNVFARDFDELTGD